MSSQPHHIRIFLSSPGDVANERSTALRVIEQLPYDPLLRGKITFEVIAWDKPGATMPMLATMTPQEAINQGLPKPSECDIVVVILWSRMGTPLPFPEYQKQDGTAYLSGTEWEYEEAMRAAWEKNSPWVVIYRCARKALLDPDDPQFDQKSEQYRRVRTFFNQFFNEDGSIRQGYNTYETLADFEREFENHMRLLVERWLQKRSKLQKAPQNIRVFLSYQRLQKSEEALATKIEEALRQKSYSLTVDDRAIPLGTRGIDNLAKALAESQVFIVLLSKESVNNEVVKFELESAQRLIGMSQDAMKILPIRINFRDEFPYPIRQYLDRVPWTLWEGAHDTTRVLTELESAISGGALSLNSPFKREEILKSTKPGTEFPSPKPFADPQQPYFGQSTGTLNPASKFYIKRDTDRLLVEQLKPAHACTVVIKAPRQMGKSSLLMHGRQYAQQMGMRVAYLDFQLLNRDSLADESLFYKRFCRWITRALNLDTLNMAHLDTYWKAEVSLGSVALCTEYVEQYILPSIKGQHLLLAIDEVDRIHETDFRSDFFSMLRNWHNSRSDSEIWQGLSLLLVISTEPYMLIENPNQSPFNVGLTLLLGDLAPDQVSQLNLAYGKPLSSAELEQLMNFIGGHPYLMQQALYHIATGKLSLKSLLDSALAEDSPFASHLLHYLFRLTEYPELEGAMQQIIREQTSPSNDLSERLYSSGLVRREQSKVVPRYRLYAEYFGHFLG